MNAPVQHAHQVEQIDCSLIDTNFANSRKTIKQADVDALKVSIQEVGLVTAITVTPSDTVEGRYTLIAGFSRFKAIQELGYTRVNCTVIKADPNALIEINLTENLTRSDLSIANQIQAMKTMIAKCGDDASDIASRLNWSTKQVNERKSMSHCTDEVLNALDNGFIKLQHAIVLSAFTPTLQNSTLAKIIDEKWTVDTLKERAGKARTPLAIAKFDTTECGGCPNNSEVQGDLFGEGASEQAICNNKGCFKAKSDAWFDSVKTQAQAEYGEVILLTQTDLNAVRPINAGMVGDTQFENCQSCKNNISIINDKIADSGYSKVKQQICRDLTCLTSCVDALNQAQVTPQATQESKASNGAVNTSTTKDKATSKAKQETPVNLAQLSDKQIKDTQGAIAKVGFELIDKEMVLLFSYAMMNTIKASTSLKETQALIAGMDGKQAFATVFDALKAKLAKYDKSEEVGHNSVRTTLIDLVRLQDNATELATRSWTTAQLPNYTVKGIIAICKASGFDKHFDNKHGKGEWAKVQKATKSQMLDKINTDNEFDWTHYAPDTQLNYIK